jgi:hypothetical protein
VGTSKSSDGPSASVALIPPWVEEVVEQDGPLDAPPDPEQLRESQTDRPATEDSDAPSADDPFDPVDPVVDDTAPIAPAARFRDARTSIGRFARSGDTTQMRRSLGHYVRSGYGGSTTMARRLTATSRTAARLGAVLQPGTRPDLAAARDAAITGGRNAQSVLNALVEAIRPIDGTQDAEASRRAVRDSLSDVLERYPDADLLDLDASQRQFVVQRFVSLDVFNRFVLDLGSQLTEHAASASIEAARLAEVREYIAATVGAAFDRVEATGSTPATSDLARITHRALRETFVVFEEYLR